MPSRRAVLLTLLLSAPAFSQTLARPGWVGSGMSASPWWKHAVIYQANPSGFNDIQGITKRLDYIHSLGIDALLLTPLQTDPATPRPSTPPSEPSTISTTSSTRPAATTSESSSN